MANTMIGKILSIGKTVNVSTTKEFLKRELVLDASRYDEFTGEKRSNYVVFQFTQKRCEELEGHHVGELVEVSFILSGRKYVKDGQDKYITDIIGYKVVSKGTSNDVKTAEGQPQAPQAVQPPQVDAPQEEMKREELPF